MLRFFTVLCLFSFAVVAHADYVQGRDLISLHYDHAPDKDDGHATVAALAVVRSLGIQPHVVSGAYGQGNSSQYQSGAEAVMTEAWGTSWENAHSNWQAAVNATYTKWIATLSNGGDIWIAEGGQADFTADVVRRIQSDNPSINTSNRIHVIQHSVWNENQANQTDLAYTKSNTDYLKIADGNGANSTADLNQKSTTFVTLAKNSQYGDAWTAAFNYLNPDTKLDFSDTVELLHILGVSTDRVATVNDFGAVYLTETVSEAEILQPSSPTVWSDSYSVNGQCYCDSTFDHGLDSTSVDTPQGTKAVSAICADIAAVFGSGSFDNRVYYNTVQCGHNPINNAADELNCPGIPTSASDYTGYRCQQTGATWNLDTLYPPEEPATTSTPTATDTPVEFPTCSNSATDEDGDGYGWEDNQSCLVIDTSPTEVVTTPVVAAPTEQTSNEQASNETSAELTFEDLFSPCSSNTIDFDGDGFGWENEQTCLVTATSSDTTNATTEQPTTVTPTETALAPSYPTCSSSVTDYDGDNYAWENNQTCVVSDSSSTTTETTVAGASPTSSPEIDLSDLFPACSDSVIDFDGDNYAWENNQTCLVTTTQESVTSPESSTQTSSTQITVLEFPLCSDSANDPDGDGYAWEDGQTCTVSADTLPASLIVFPLCGSSVVDENNDGYAWENGQSCIVGSN